jgi:predicted ester cyclase
MKTIKCLGAIVVSSLLIVMTSCQDQQAKEELAKLKQGESSKATNIELAKKFYAYLDAVNLDSVKAMCTSDTKMFYESGEPMSFADMEPLIKTFYSSFPDYKHEIQDLFAADDKVVARLSYSGTFAKKFMDIKPTGAKFTYKGIHIFQFANNKVSKLWGVEDELGMMAQLGMELKPKK